MLLNINRHDLIVLLTMFENIKAFGEKNGSFFCKGLKNEKI